jgi:hypothetical protein
LLVIIKDLGHQTSFSNVSKESTKNYLSKN